MSAACLNTSPTVLLQCLHGQVLFSVCLGSRRRGRHGVGAGLQPGAVLLRVHPEHDGRQASGDQDRFTAGSVGSGQSAFGTRRQAATILDSISTHEPPCVRLTLPLCFQYISYAHISSGKHKSKTAGIKTYIHKSIKQCSLVYWPGPAQAHAATSHTHCPPALCTASMYARTTTMTTSAVHMYPRSLPAARCTPHPARCTPLRPQPLAAALLRAHAAAAPAATTSTAQVLP